MRFGYFHVIYVDRIITYSDSGVVEEIGTPSNVETSPSQVDPLDSKLLFLALQRDCSRRQDIIIIMGNSKLLHCIDSYGIWSSITITAMLSAAFVVDY